MPATNASRCSTVCVVCDNLTSQAHPSPAQPSPGPGYWVQTFILDTWFKRYPGNVHPGYWVQTLCSKRWLDEELLLQLLVPLGVPEN